MKANKYILNTALTAVLFLALLAAVLVRTFAPAMIFPVADIPNLVLVSLAALLADHYLAPQAKRCYLCIPVLSALAFGLLPFGACFVGAIDAVKLGLLGGVVFTATTWLFTSIQDRISSGPSGKLTPVLSAVGLYLAAQCFAGWSL